MKVALCDTSNCFQGIPVDVMKQYAKLKGIKLYFYVYCQDTIDSLVLTKCDDAYEYISTKDYGDTIGDDSQIFFKNDTFFGVDELKRNDPLLIQAIEETGSKGMRLVEIPDDVDFVITEWEDGTEIIEEKHRCWY